MKVKHTIVAAEGLSSRQREKIAKQSKDPKELLRMAYDNSAAVRRAVAQNKATPEAAFRILVDDADRGMRELVAQYTDAHDILVRLADDEDEHVRREVARRIDDPDILARLADDTDALVRKTVAERTDDPDILAKLADDEKWTVREAVAKRTDDPDILAKLADDENHWVRETVARRMNKSDIVNRDSSPTPELTSKPTRERKPTQTDWSIPIYSITNYSEIEDEIDKVVHDAANAYARQYLGGTADINVPNGAYDNDLDITITFHTPDGDEVKTVSAADILGPATARNKKKDCVKLLLNWMTKSL